MVEIEQKYLSGPSEGPPEPGSGSAAKELQSMELCTVAAGSSHEPKKLSIRKSTRKNFSESKEVQKIETPSNKVENTSFMTTTTQRKELVASDIQRISSMMRFMLQYIRQADAHIHQLEDVDMKDKEN